MSSETRSRLVNIIIIIISVYVFLLSIKLLGHSFKLFGKGFAETMITWTTNPFAGLIIGIVATSLIQSSSTTTSIVVGLVAGGALGLDNAIPIIMGANIGTTITNSLVSMGHLRNRMEFKRAFSASVVHDFFNILAVIILFPIELAYHPIAKAAGELEKLFSGAGGYTLFNPLKFIINPVIDIFDSLLGFIPHYPIILTVISVVLLFASLSRLIVTIRGLMLQKLEVIINEYLFRNAFLGLVLGMFMTFIVQSSSVTTSLIIPLAGAGIITVAQIFPYTLGANIGTTLTAILAAMATQNHVAVTVAFSHLCYNIFGIVIIYPIKFIPIRLAEWVGETAGRSTRNLVLFIAVYLMLHFIPVILILVT